MGKLEKLINELCPDGIEVKKVWEVTIWDKNFNGVPKYKQKRVNKYSYLLAKDLFNLESEEGDIILLSTGEKSGKTTEKLASKWIHEGEIVAIPWGGTPRVKYVNGKFVTADNRIATSIDKNLLSTKFLYYWMDNNINIISRLYRGSGIKHPSMSDILDLENPLPAIPVQ